MSVINTRVSTDILIPLKANHIYFNLKYVPSFLIFVKWKIWKTDHERNVWSRFGMFFTTRHKRLSIGVREAMMAAHIQPWFSMEAEDKDVGIAAGEAERHWRYMSSLNCHTVCLCSHTIHPECQDQQLPEPKRSFNQTVQILWRIVLVAIRINRNRSVGLNLLQWRYD